MDQSFLALFFILLVGGLIWSWFSGSDAPYIATSYKNLDKILKTAGVKKSKIFYELGSGDGRVVLAAANLGADSNGVEQSWVRVWYSRLKAKKLGLSNCHFFHGNLFDRHYYPADVVYIYMLQKCVDSLEKILKNELTKGAVVITQKYHFKKWKPFKKTGDFWYYRT